MNPIITFFIVFTTMQTSFKEAQLKYSRVRQAYQNKESVVDGLLSGIGIKKDELRLYLRAYKTEKKLEVWAKNRRDGQFKLLKVYTVCKTSGKIGPKRKRGDLQVPEGFYHIDRFNPVSKFHLSLGINYPNRSDKILGNKKDLGGDIFIHGDCVTIGCLPITDEMIEEIYLMSVEAKNSGQETIPVTIFPAKPDSAEFTELLSRYPETENHHLWKSLQKAYDYFNDNKKLPEITFLKDGRTQVDG